MCYETVFDRLKVFKAMIKKKKREEKKVHLQYMAKECK
jgi:hypothetical protein